MVSLFFEGRVLRWVALHIMASRGRSRNPVAFTFVSCVAACAVSFRAVSIGASVLCGCALAFLCCAPRAASRWQRDGVDSLYASPCGLLDCWDVAACARLWRVHVPNTPNTAHARAAASVVASFRLSARLSLLARGGRVGCAEGASRIARSVALRVRFACFSPFVWGVRGAGSAGYLVDPASSHMLVSKIKPCMSKYKRLVL